MFLSVAKPSNDVFHHSAGFDVFQLVGECVTLSMETELWMPSFSTVMVPGVSNITLNEPRVFDRNLASRAFAIQANAVMSAGGLSNKEMLFRVKLRRASDSSAQVSLVASLPRQRFCVHLLV